MNLILPLILRFLGCTVSSMFFFGSKPSLFQARVWGVWSNSSQCIWPADSQINAYGFSSWNKKNSARFLRMFLPNREKCRMAMCVLSRATRWDHWCAAATRVPPLMITGLGKNWQTVLAGGESGIAAVLHFSLSICAFATPEN